MTGLLVGMVKKSSLSQSSIFSTTWLLSRLQKSTKIVKDGILHKAVQSMLVKKVIACLETHNSGILQHIIPGTQTLKKVKTNNRFY